VDHELKRFRNRGGTPKNTPNEKTYSQSNKGRANRKKVRKKRMGPAVKLEGGEKERAVNKRKMLQRVRMGGWGVPGEISESGRKSLKTGCPWNVRGGAEANPAKKGRHHRDTNSKEQRCERPFGK